MKHCREPWPIIMFLPFRYRSLEPLVYVCVLSSHYYIPLRLISVRASSRRFIFLKSCERILSVWVGRSECLWPLQCCVILIKQNVTFSRWLIRRLFVRLFVFLNLLLINIYAEVSSPTKKKMKMKHLSAEKMCLRQIWFEVKVYSC